VLFYSALVHPPLLHLPPSILLLSFSPSLLLSFLYAVLCEKKNLWRAQKIFTKGANKFTIRGEKFTNRGNNFALSKNITNLQAEK
jgi:hypothetical protein